MKDKKIKKKDKGLNIRIKSRSDFNFVAHFIKYL